MVEVIEAFVRRLRNALLAAGVVLAVASLPVRAAEPSIALVITNATYDSPLLTKQEPQTDGIEFRKRLRAAGFPEDRIKHLEDPTKEELSAFVADAATRYADASAVVVFYSGHGILYGSEARLLPKDFSLVALSDTTAGRSIEEQTVPIRCLLRVAGTGDQPALFIFDACRDDMAGANRTFFSTLHAADINRAAQRGDPSGSKLRDDRSGTFDNQGEDAIRDDPSEGLYRENAVILFGGVFTRRFGPGISYGSLVYKTEDGAALSELTGAIIAHYDKGPNDGVMEIFARASGDVFKNTERQEPRQLPFGMFLKTFGNPGFAQFANPPSLVGSVAPPSPLRSMTEAYAGTLADAQIKARTGVASQITSAPFTLNRFMPNTVLAQIAPDLRSMFPTDALILAPPDLGKRIGIDASLVARIWQPDDRRVLGAEGQPEIRLPSVGTTQRALSGDRVEFSQRIVASPGFRILSSRTVPLSAKDLLDYRTERENDPEGALAEVKTWRVPADAAGQPRGEFTARLVVTEQRPKASFSRSLTDVFTIRADQHAALALTPAEVAQLDAIEIHGADGTILAELHKGDRDVPLGPLRAALQATPAGIVLQIASP